MTTPKEAQKLDPSGTQSVFDAFTWPSWPAIGTGLVAVLFLWAGVRAMI
jgi:hypothetical protein